MAETTHVRDTETQAGRLYEGSDIDARRVSLLGLGLIALLVVVMALTYFGYQVMTGRTVARRPAPPFLAYTRAPGPGPRLTTQAPEELRKLRAMEEATLNSYAWLDKEDGVVRIPIERAMEIVAQKGLPARGEKGRNREMHNASRKDAKAQR